MWGSILGDHPTNVGHAHQELRLRATAKRTGAREAKLRESNRFPPRKWVAHTSPVTEATCGNLPRRLGCSMGRPWGAQQTSPSSSQSAGEHGQGNESPFICSRDGAVPTEQSEPLWPGSTTPLVRLQYNFVRESEGGILRGKPSDDLIDLQTRSWEATGGNLSMSPGHPDMFRESEASVPQEKGSQQPTATCFAAVEQNQGTVPWGYEQSSTQDDIKCNALPGNNARREGCCCDRGTREALQTGVSHRPSSNMGDGFHEPLSFRVHKGVLTKKAPKLCPNCGRKLSLGLNPAAHPLAPSKEKSFQCPDCGHQLRFCTGVPKHQADPADDWEGLFSQLSLGPLPNQMGAGVEKPFKCPDCRKGFSHRSSIRRHQRLHKKENTSPDFGQERNSGLGPKLLMHPKSKPVQHPSDRMGSIPSSPPKPSCLHNPRFPALSGDSGQGGSVASEAPSDRASAEKPFLCPDCGKTFSVKSTVLRHQMLHWAQRPFKCSYCDKSYIQKSHLKRHEQMKHGCPRSGSCS
ncbi:hypothetical protein EYD10_04701 [Varanus komodoensis]|nr:hypothetical protein EYD10_04701 [Varanus komodoensis]